MNVRWTSLFVLVGCGHALPAISAPNPERDDCMVDANGSILGVSDDHVAIVGPGRESVALVNLRSAEEHWRVEGNSLRVVFFAHEKIAILSAEDFALMRASDGTVTFRAGSLPFSTLSDGVYGGYSSNEGALVYWHTSPPARGTPPSPEQEERERASRDHRSGFTRIVRDGGRIITEYGEGALRAALDAHARASSACDRLSAAQVIVDRAAQSIRFSVADRRYVASIGDTWNGPLPSDMATATAFAFPAAMATLIVLSDEAGPCAPRRHQVFVFDAQTGALLWHRELPSESTDACIP